MIKRGLHKIRSSFTTQLALWVAGFVVVTSGIVMGLLTSFSQEVIRNESIDATLQALENTALRIDNNLRLSEMTARMEKHRFRMNRSVIERLLDQNNSQEQLQRSLPNVQLFVTRRDSTHLDTYIAGNERGYRLMEHEGKKVYIFSQPLQSRQYSLTAVCPADDINSKFSRMHQVLLFWGIGGVLLLLIVLYYVIAHHLRPLHLLADTAQSIASGNLDTPIPDSSHKHETGRLQSNLKKMQGSLRAYMDEMQQKQTTLTAHNAELQAAYKEAQTYEDKKAKFLHDMTERMGAPVERLCRNTETVCRNYPDISKAEMQVLQTDIMRDSEEITELLDQLIVEPAAS